MVFHVAITAIQDRFNPHHMYKYKQEIITIRAAASRAQVAIVRSSRLEEIAYPQRVDVHEGNVPMTSH